jgi:hypothetical protein
MEADVYLERIATPNIIIDARLIAWIPNMGSSRSRETKYYRIVVDLY